MKVYRNISYYHLCYWQWLSIITITAGSKIERDLLLELLTNYTPSIRPVSSPDNVLNLTFNMRIWQVLSIDEKVQKITIQNYFQMRWKNEMLTWDPKKWGNVDNIIVRPEKVWLPDIVLLNGADADGISIQKDTDTVRLDYNGYNEWFPKVMLTASFIADTKYFPYDVQRFSFRFESWSLPEVKLRIFKDSRPMVDEHYVTSTEWKLLEMGKEVSSVGYSNNSYSDITFTFTFLRKPSYFVMTLIVPCLILVAIVLFSYFLPASSGERMGVVVTVLLGFAVFLEVVSTSLPQNGNSTAILSVYILATMFECALSFLVTCIVIKLLNKENNEEELQPPPRWVRKYLLHTIEQANVINQWKPHKYSLHEIEAQEDFMKKPVDSVKLTNQANLMKSLQLKQLNNISRHLERITTSLTEQQEEGKIRMEWTRLANMVDRISFWGFLLIAILSYCILQFGYKRYY